MQVPLVMTIIGKDRPGLVDSLARVVAEHGGNWLESRMCQLGGEFAGILRVHVPASHQDALKQALAQLSSVGLTVVVRSDQTEIPAQPQQRVVLEVVGQDRPGIIHKISHVLAVGGVNVEELHSECESAAMSGETLFKAQATLQLPKGYVLAELRTELEKIASDLVVDLNLQPMPERKATARPA